MKELSFEKMEEVNGGWSTVSFICGSGFAGYGAITTYALALGGVTLGATALVGLGIGLIGAAVCSLYG